MNYDSKRYHIDLAIYSYNSISKSEKSKRILKGVSGRFLSGQISAILGPSGAGKTTLMNILAGYKTSKASGDILINGKPRCLESFRKISCYIKQDEQLPPFLTVKESMEVAAGLKLGRSNSNLSKKRIVRGEKKRLTVAFELINNPLVMFFDEPTSGLDSYNSYQSILFLKTLAKGDRNVICTIHQPSAKLFEQFDYVYVLAEGHCVYRGIVTNCLPFISSISLECPSHYNPADFSK
ncbi:ATP-binding cassette sub-family G member 1 [Armadillidium nasatum]|uniref:ATP-binding cassette sub-family G member 1 n=1 Tax=Armadillidium nasatum TaxID=96803 RepID=A0A5N5T516_9CRUS|nr:ATP-binding cassette sub-family G member 1 [Armadillidium nasatum]